MDPRARPPMLPSPRAEHGPVTGSYVADQDERVPYAAATHDVHRPLGRGRAVRPAAMAAELNFGSVLGSRAARDAWIAPGRSQTRREPAADGLPRLDHPVLWPCDRCPAQCLDRAGQRLGLRRLIGQAAGGGIVLLSGEEALRCGGVSPQRGGLLHRARRDRTGRRRHLTSRLGKMPATRVNPPEPRRFAPATQPSAGRFFPSCGTAR